MSSSSIDIDVSESYLDLFKSYYDLDRDNEVNWRHDMPSNIIYTYIRKGVIFDKPYVTSCWFD